MRKDLGSKPYLMPMPVLIVGTYNEDGSANAMNAAYGCLSDFTEVSIFIDSYKKTIINAKREGAFTVAFADKSHVVDADYVGIVSGNKVEKKLQKTDFKTEKSLHVNAPTITNLPMTIECELLRYDEENSNLVGKIVSVTVDENYLGEDGKPDLEKMELITYNPVQNFYNIIGGKVGDAFNDGKKLK